MQRSFVTTARPTSRRSAESEKGKPESENSISRDLWGHKRSRETHQPVRKGAFITHHPLPPTTTTTTPSVLFAYTPWYDDLLHQRTQITRPPTTASTARPAPSAMRVISHHVSEV